MKKVIKTKVLNFWTKHTISTCFKSILRLLSIFLDSGKDITRKRLARRLYSTHCFCGKFYVGRTHQQFVERFIENRNSIYNSLGFTKPPESFTSALAEQIYFFNPDHFVQFKEVITISNYKGFTEWALEGLEIKKDFCGVYQLRKRL